MTITPGIISSDLHQIHHQDGTKIQTVMGTNFWDWQDSGGVRQNLSQKQPKLWSFQLSQQPNFFKGRHPINVYLTSRGFFLCWLHPPRCWRRLTAALWCSKFTWGVFCTWPASIVHDFFYNDSIKHLQAEAHGICAHSSNLRTGLWNSQQPAGDK